MEPTETSRKSFFVTGPGDVTAARRAAKEIAAAEGFDATKAEEVALIVAEMGSNIHKHATRGTLSIAVIADGGRKGLRIEAKDRGPGIADPERSLADGFSTAGTLGDGLGAINRLVDSMELASDGNVGTHLIVEKWLWKTGAAPVVDVVNPFDCGAASRAHAGLPLNGDSFVIYHCPGNTLVAAIDGVGHGQYAHKAATTARRYVEMHARSSLADIFMGAARACRGTRGVVMALARFDWKTRNVQFASVGNIECRLHNAGRGKLFSVRRGVVGLQLPKPLVTEEHWEKGAIMVLHSDGVSTSWRFDEISATLVRPASVIARRILVKYGKENDDATVVVIKDRSDANG